MSTGRILEHTNNGMAIALCYCGNKLNIKLFFGGLRFSPDLILKFGPIPKDRKKCKDGLENNKYEEK